MQLGGTRIVGLVDTFGERAPGERVALFGSTGNFIVAVVNGNAALQLGVSVGDPFLVTVGYADVTPRERERQ